MQSPRSLFAPGRRPSTASRCPTRVQETVKKMTINADNFWIELDRLLRAPRPTAAQMEALVERYGRVWPDIHARALNSPDHFKSLTRALVISGMTPQDAQAKIGSREE